MCGCFAQTDELGELHRIHSGDQQYNMPTANSTTTTITSQNETKMTHDQRTSERTNGTTDGNIRTCKNTMTRQLDKRDAPKWLWVFL